MQTLPRAAATVLIAATAGIAAGAVAPAATSAVHIDPAGADFMPGPERRPVPVAAAPEFHVGLARAGHAPRAEQPPVPVAAAPALELVTADPEQRLTAEQALAQFDDLGLDLPPLVIEYSESREPCKGAAGLHYPPGRGPNGAPPEASYVVICNQSRIVLLHELGHAWDYHNLTDDTRQRLLDHWGLERWRDLDDPWEQRGVEAAAETIALTLFLTRPTTRAGTLDYVCSFPVLTGRPLPVHLAGSCPTGSEEPQIR